MSIRDDVRNMKKDAPILAASKVDVRNAALFKIKENLEKKKQSIF